MSHHNKLRKLGQCENWSQHEHNHAVEYPADCCRWNLRLVSSVSDLAEPRKYSRRVYFLGWVYSSVSMCFSLDLHCRLHGFPWTLGCWQKWHDWKLCRWVLQSTSMIIWLCHCLCHDARFYCCRLLSPSDRPIYSSSQPIMCPNKLYIT